MGSLLGEIEEAWQKRLEVLEDDTILDSELKPEAGLWQVFARSLGRFCKLFMWA